jgi:hypothetical protein
MYAVLKLQNTAFPKFQIMAMVLSKHQRSGLLSSGNSVSKPALAERAPEFIFPALAISQTQFPQEKNLGNFPCHRPFQFAFSLCQAARTISRGVCPILCPVASGMGLFVH